MVAHAVTGQFFTPFSGNEQEHPTTYGNIGIQAYLFGKLDVRVQRIDGKYMSKPSETYAVFADRYADIPESKCPDPREDHKRQIRIISYQVVLKRRIINMVIQWFQKWKKNEHVREKQTPESSSDKQEEKKISDKKRQTAVICGLFHKDSPLLMKKNLNHEAVLSLIEL